jgi:hypothetical protein
VLQIFVEGMNNFWKYFIPSKRPNRVLHWFIFSWDLETGGHLLFNSSKKTHVSTLVCHLGVLERVRSPEGFDLWL